MAYSPTTWVEAQTKLGPTNLNKLENGLQSAAAVADAAIPAPAAPATNNGLVWGGAAWVAAYPPGHEYAYNEFTGNVSVTATTEATANTVVTASSVTFDGATVVVLEFFAPLAQPPAAVAELDFWLYDGSGSVGHFGYVVNPAANSGGVAVVLKRRFTPSAAAHVYSVRASVTPSGTGGVLAGAGGTGVTVPGYIRIVKA